VVLIFNKSVNFSHFTDLLVYEYSKEKEIHQSETVPGENMLSVDDLEKEHNFYTEPDREY